MRGELAATWGVVGVALILVRAIWALLPIALQGLRGDLSPVGWMATGLWVGCMAYFEGFRGFQRSFSPRVIVRAGELARAPGLLRSLLAPLYCMSLFSAERPRLIRSWCLVVGITVLVIGVSRLEQPLRGIIDFGVVVGLSWGLISLLANCFQPIMRRRSGPDSSPCPTQPRSP